jgi:hypothetical protein
MLLYLNPTVNNTHLMPAAFTAAAAAAANAFASSYITSPGNHHLRSRLHAVLLVQVEHPVTKAIHQFWFDNPVVARPYNEESSSTASDPRLLPRDCREGVRGLQQQHHCYVEQAATVTSSCSQWHRAKLLRNNQLFLNTCSEIHAGCFLHLTIVIPGYPTAAPRRHS